MALATTRQRQAMKRRLPLVTVPLMINLVGQLQSGQVESLLVLGEMTTMGLILEALTSLI
jgi:hypothetical protein